MINTRLYLRLLSPKIKAGIVTGRGGTSEDVSKIGIQLSNSMIGDSSIKAAFFVYRMICANGLILESLKDSGLVRHSGKEETLLKRLVTNISPVLKKLRYIPRLIKSIGEINYNVELLVKAGGAKKVYDIIPLGYWEMEERKKLSGKSIAQFDVSKISDYPYRYGGRHSKQVFLSKWRDNQSMYDFINVFTEYAQTLDLRKRISVEEKSGDLVNWILNNKKKFL